MSQHISLQQTPAQQLSITPQLIQTLKITQYSISELIEYIQHEVGDNPFLMEKEQAPREKVEIEKMVSEDAKNYHLEYTDSSNKYSNSSSNHNRMASNKDKSSIIERVAAYVIPLSEVLTNQLYYHFPEGSLKYRIGEYIIGSLDKDGYLPEKAVEEIKSELHVDDKLFEEAHAIFKTFEPDGIASRNLKECLLTQIKKFSESQDTTLEGLIIENCLDLLQKKKYKKIARKLKIPLQKIETTVHHISLLEPKPARMYQSTTSSFIIPDMTVARVGDELMLYMNEELIPKIEFNHQYKKLLKIKKNPLLNKYLKEKEEKANLLLISIKYRKSNLQKMMEKIIEIQRDFFEKGPKYLHPYTLVKLSEYLSINQGTLSRIANSKYVETQWGVFSLRFFFPSYVKGKNGKVSSKEIKEVMKEIIREYEAKGDHLSDRKIAEVLNKRGYKVARRTVTKYRNNLLIFSSNYR